MKACTRLEENNQLGANRVDLAYTVSQHAGIHIGNRGLGRPMTDHQNKGGVNVYRPEKGNLQYVIMRVFAECCIHAAQKWMKIPRSIF